MRKIPGGALVTIKTNFWRNYETKLARFLDNPGNFLRRNPWKDLQRKSLENLRKNFREVLLQSQEKLWYKGTPLDRIVGEASGEIQKEIPHPSIKSRNKYLRDMRRNTVRYLRKYPGYNF